MFAFRRLLPRCALPLFALVALGGCEAWQQPSILTTRPMTPAPEPKREVRGGFTVTVDVPGQPASARVMADIGEFARQRGFVHQSGASSTAAQRFTLDKIVLDVSYDAAHLLVRAYLHSSGYGGDRKIIAQFDADFQAKYDGLYGDQSAILESDYGDGTAVSPARGRGGRGGG